MKDQTANQTLTARTEAIRSAYAALNRNDIDGFIADFDPLILRVEWEGFPSEGKFLGIDAVREHVVQGRSTWAEGSCAIENLTAAGDTIIALVHVHVRQVDQTDWLEGRVADVYKWRDGKITEFRSFFTEEQALEFVNRGND
ncbi:MAG: nuclear transport factor 2 family protein [Pyrinomonadaceae bacterium]